MKKLVYSVLVALVIFGSVDAKVYTNKTFLMPRSHNENLAMEYTGWHKQFREIDENRWGGTFQATGFYQASTNKTDLGKYFGMYNNATGPNVTNPYAGQIMDFIFSNLFYPQGASTTNNEVAFLPDASFMIHDATISLVKADYWDVKATFRPKHTSYGVRFDYHQKLDKLAKGLFFKVTVPVVHVKHDMNVCYTGDRLSGKVPGTTKTVTLADYLSGKFENTEHPNKQLKLTHAKIGGGTTATSGTGTDCGSKKIAGCGDGGMTKTGVADVDVYLGYNFLYKEHKHLGVNLCLTIPTNNTPRGEWLFEPVLGLAGHWALGGGLDCAFEIWQHENMSLEFIGAVNYKYVLDETEKRTLGFKYNDSIGQTNIICTAGKRVGFGHYRLGGQRGEKCLFPLANVLTRDVGVQPGSQVDVLANFALNWGNFTFDLGYNLFAKEGESVMVKCWPDYTYAIANAGWDSAYFSNTSFGNLDGDVWDGDYDDTSKANWINKEDLLVQDAATPVYVTHKVLGGVTYAFNKWEYPLMFGFGGSWEFTQGTNSALDGYALWTKLGITF